MRGEVKALNMTGWGWGGREALQVEEIGQNAQEEVENTGPDKLKNTNEEW